MLDQLPYTLACCHNVVIGRLQNVASWTCEECGQTTDLSVSPDREMLAKDLDTATQVDIQAKQRGLTVLRVDGFSVR
jgi:hypothetical protein